MWLLVQVLSEVVVKYELINKGLGLFSPFQTRHLDTDVAPYISSKMMCESVNLKTAGEYPIAQYIWDWLNSYFRGYHETYFSNLQL